MHHRNKSKGVKSVQLLTFKDSGKPFYSGYCKIGVNAILQHLNIKPYNKNINELLISLDQNYILKENILFINFLTNVPKCVLIFANRNLAQKVFEVITKNKNEKKINQDAQFLEKFPIIFNKESTDVEIMELLNVICLKIKKGEINERNYIEDGCNKHTESSRKRRHSEQNTGKKLNVCKKSRTWKLNVAKILHKPAYEIADKNVFGSTTRKLIIFDSKNEKLCYEYFLHCGHFCCAGCRVERKVRRANICNFGKKNEYVELFNTDHFCDPQPYNPKKIPAQAKIVKKPYYEYRKADINGESKKILLIFDLIDRNLCYEYFDRGTDFRCKGCQKLKIMRIAKVYNDGAEDEYIELLNDKHACEPSLYEQVIIPTSKILIKKPAYKIEEEIKNGIKKQYIIIFNPTNRELCYEYRSNYFPQFTCLGCSIKKKSRNIKLHNFGKENEYVEVFNKEHVCELRPYIKDKFGKQEELIIHKPDFEIKVTKLNEKESKKLIVFNLKDKKYCYQYSISGERFLCRNCLKNDHRVYAKLEKDKDGDEYLRHGPESHICKPQLYTIQCAVTNKAGQRESTAAKDIFRRTQATANDSRAAATSFVPPMSTPLQPANNLRKPRFATPIPQDPQRQQGFQSTLQQQQQVQPRPYRLATNGLASLLYQNQPELNETQIGPSRSSFSTSYKQAFTYDQSYITSHPALPKLASTVDPVDLDNIHDIFFNEKIDGRKKMERILQLWELDFENERTPINIDNLFAAQICRPIDDEHAEDLAHRLADVGEGNFSTILNKSLFMIFEETIPESGVTRYGVIDGNIRLAAVHNYNENVTSSNLIRYITADYILKQKPSIAQAIAISTMASKVAHEDQLEYNEEQILRNARFILKNECKLLKIVPDSDSTVSAQQWQRDHEKIVRIEIAKILNVDVMKVYSSIWRLIRIPDDDFETMLPSFAKYATSIAKLASLCTTYRRRPTRTVQLCTSVHETADDFFEALGDISGWDWVETLKDKTAYDVTKSDAEHAQLIMGNLYESYMEDERNAVLERFVAWRGISEASRKKTYPTPLSKLTYLVEKFPVFLNAAPPSGSRILARSSEPDDEIISSKKGRQRLNGRSKTSKTQLKLNSSAEMHTLRADYFNHLQNQPHVAGLLAFCLKQNSKNLEIFPDNNIIRRRANEYTSAGGTFDWDKFNQGN